MQFLWKEGDTTIGSDWVWIKRDFAPGKHTLTVIVTNPATKKYTTDTVQISVSPWLVGENNESDQRGLHCYDATNHLIETRKNSEVIQRQSWRKFS